MFKIPIKCLLSIVFYCVYDINNDFEIVNNIADIIN